MLDIVTSVVAFCLLVFSSFTALTDPSMSQYILDSELPYV